MKIILISAVVAASIALLCPVTLLAQQETTLTGTVVDGSHGEPMVRATVRVLNTDKGAYTNTSGTYKITGLPPGTYSIKVSYVGYTEKVVEGIKIEAGRTVRQDASISVKAKGPITVLATRSKQTENSALTERKKSSSVDDAISAQEIAKAPASDAGDAMKRVTGVTMVGKNVVVRGIGERYNTTQLNGVNLPSPEPEKKSVPFDIFPSSMISRLTTVKTFTPDNPGDFAGGLVKITTKDDPGSFLFSVSASGGFNTQTHGVDALAYAGGSTDFLGIDDGTRAIPENIPVGRRSSTEAQAELLSRFDNNVFSPVTSSLPLNQSYSLTIGNQYDVGFPLGFIVSGSYAGSSNFRVEKEAYPLLSLTDGKHDLRYDYATRTSERSVLWGGLASLSAQFAPEHKVSLRTIYNHSADDETRLTEGFYNQSTTGNIRATRLRFVERTIFSTQLAGEHQFEGLLNSKVDWRAAVSMADRSEPDNRTTTYFRSDDGIYRFANNFGSGNGRFFSELDDTESNLGLDWTIPFLNWNDQVARIKVGGLGRFRSRDFAARRFIFSTNSSNDDTLALSPERLLSVDNVRSGSVTFNDETLPTDSYDASETIGAGYAMIDLPITSSLRFIGGARFEQWKLNLYPVNILSGERNVLLSAHRSNGDVLPSANLIYSISEEMNLRAAVTQTVARPEFRELAAFRFDDYRQSTYGNPALERTKITNYDLRWEWFPGDGEVIAVSGFYKKFLNPIEQFYLIGGSGVAVEAANANDATTYGAEFEFRKSLDFITPSLSEFSIGSNFSLVKSQVEFTPGEAVRVFDGVTISEFSSEALTSQSRPLQGQSPYVFNVSLGYDNAGWGTSVNLLYNIFGERLAIVGTDNVPDTYEQPRGLLDLNVSQKLPYGLQLRLTGRNLLDQETLLQQEFTDGGGAVTDIVDVQRYISGRSLSLGISFNLDQLQMQNLDATASSESSGK